MARGNSARTDRCGLDRMSVRAALGRQVRRAFGYNLRQGGSVHVGYVESTRRLAGSLNTSYHGLPSTGERPGRKVPQVFEGGIESKVDNYGLDGWTAVGHAGTKDHAEGGYGRVGSRNGLWNNADRTRNIGRAEQQPGCVRTSATNEVHGRTTGASARRMAWHEGRSKYQRLRRSRVRFRETRCFAQSVSNAVHGSI